METLQRTANRGSVSTGFNIDNSVVFETANSERLSRTNTNTGQRRTFSISAWIKRTNLGYNRTIGVGVSGNDQQIIIFNASDQLEWYDYHGGAYSFNYKTNRLFRDTSAWYHFLFAVDTEQGTESNRVRLYINGVEETSFATQTEPSQNRDTNWNYANGSKEFGNILNEAPFASCYMSEVAFVDDAQLAPTDVGEFDEDTGIWKPIDISGLTFGTSGSYCEFKNASALGEDSSSNGNDFTAANITAADQATDTPTNNFATINSRAGLGMGGTPFKFPSGSTEIKRDPDDTGGWVCVVSTMAVNKGKWYAELEVLESPSVTMYGYTTVAYHEGGSGLNYPQFYLGNSPNNTGYYSNGDGANDSIYEDVSYPSAGVQSSAGTIISIALDCDNNKIHFANNGTYTNSSNPANNTNGFPVIDDYVYFAHASNAGNKTYKTNLGGYTSDAISSAASDANGYGTFEYAPPSGYYALCTKNLAEFG